MCSYESDSPPRRNPDKNFQLPVRLVVGSDGPHRDRPQLRRPRWSVRQREAGTDDQ